MIVKLLNYTPLKIADIAIGRCLDKQSKDGVCNTDRIDRVANKFKHSCYDDKTEILTENGWKLFKELSIDEKVCTLNPLTKDVEYQIPTNHVEYDVSEDMIHFENKSIDLMVTSNHKIYATSVDSQKNRKYKTRDFVLVEADQMFNKRHYQTKRSNGHIGARHNEYVMKILGFFLGDGTQMGKKTLSFNLKKRRKIEYIKNTVSALDGWSLLSKGNNKYVIYFPEEYSSLFKNSLINGEKTIPSNILYGSSSNSLKMILDGYLNADGDYKLYKKGINEIATTSIRMVSDLSVLAVHIGYGYSISYISKAKADIEWKSGLVTKKENIKDCYTIRLPSRKLDVRMNNSSIESKPKFVNYTGKVYCVEVPNHILCVRRGGKHIWSGNSTIEHLFYNFEIKDISRALLQELVRHRVASYSVKSSRYTLGELKKEPPFIEL